MSAGRALCRRESLVATAGAGRRLSRALSRRESLAAPRVAPATARLLALPVLALALVPLALNWSWASRADDWTARDWAYNVLMSVEPYGILVTSGDNDSFPLWYLQKVERLREDVTIVLTPYLNLGWYPKQLRDLTRPCPPGIAADDDPTRIICQRPLDPARFPAPLVAAGVLDGVRPPEDSILPMDDDEIDRIAASPFIARDDLRLRAGRIDTIIPAGTTILPQDSFITAILRTNIGRRPVHFTASASIAKLGLTSHTVRHGLTLRIDDAPADRAADSAGAGGPLVPMPPLYADALGAWVDLPRTDTLLHDVFLHRGRVTDPHTPWTDPANNIPTHYVLAHSAAAQALAPQAPTDAAHHTQQARTWQALLD